MEDSSYRLVPSRLLDDPATAQYLNELSHNIFDRLKLTRTRKTPVEMSTQTEPEIKTEEPAAAMEVQSETPSTSAVVKTERSAKVKIKKPKLKERGTQTPRPLTNKGPRDGHLIDLVPPKYFHVARQLIPQIVGRMDKLQHFDETWELLVFCLANTSSTPSSWMHDHLEALIPFKKYAAPSKERYFVQTAVNRIRTRPKAATRFQAQIF